MRLIDRLRPGPDSARGLLNPLDWFSFDGSGYPIFGVGAPVQYTYDAQPVSEPDRTLEAYTSSILHRHGPIAALVFVRQLVFSSVEFKWQSLTDRTLYGNRLLNPLEEPWPGGTTQNLLAKCSVDADMAGNSFWARNMERGGLTRLRPDWVDILLRRDEFGAWEKSGYQYWPDGKHGDADPIKLALEEVVHFMPLQDPVNPWRGMSWITPVIREVMVDQAATTHQQAFMENAATPNLAVKLDPSVTPEQLREYRQANDDKHAGARNAYKTMYLGGGADVTVVGTDLSKLDLKSVQGGLETRLAAAAGVPPSVVGFREGLSGSSLNAGNYGQARRRFADGTLHPLWREAAGSFQRVLDVPAGARLWFDTRHVPFLREDAKDEAEIVQTQATSVRTLIDAGYDPDAVVAAVRGADVGRLTGTHTGLTSVQLTPPADQSGQEDNDA